MKIFLPIIIGLFSIAISSCNSSERIDIDGQKKNAIQCDHNAAMCTHGPGAHHKTTSKMLNDTTSKVKLIYYYDALCGWCYGFSPVMSQIEKTYGDQVDIEVISGGLFIGNRAGRVNDVAPHIKQGAYKSVESRTGVKFGDVFLKDVFGEGNMILNSLPATIALCIVKEEQPKDAVKFAGMLLAAVYSDGLNPIDLDGLADYAAKLGFDKASFKHKLSDEKYLKVVEQEHQLFRSSPHSGMPAVVIEKDGQQYPLAKGFTTFEQLKSRLEPHLVGVR